MDRPSILRDPAVTEKLLLLGPPIEIDPDCLERFFMTMGIYFQSGTALFRPSPKDYPYGNLEFVYSAVRDRRMDAPSGSTWPDDLSTLLFRRPLEDLRSRVLLTAVQFCGRYSHQPSSLSRMGTQFPELKQVMASISRLKLPFAENPVNDWVDFTSRVCLMAFSQAINTKPVDTERPWDLPTDWPDPLALMIDLCLGGGFLKLPTGTPSMMSQGDYTEACFRRFEDES